MPKPIESHFKELQHEPIPRSATEFVALEASKGNRPGDTALKLADLHGSMTADGVRVPFDDLYDSAGEA